MPIGRNSAFRTLEPRDIDLERIRELYGADAASPYGGGSPDGVLSLLRAPVTVPAISGTTPVEPLAVAVTQSESRTEDTSPSLVVAPITRLPEISAVTGAGVNNGVLPLSSTTTQLSTRVDPLIIMAALGFTALVFIAR